MTVHIHALPEPPTITGPTVLNCSIYELQLVASEPEAGTYNWSDGNIGATDDIYTGGPYRVWFTDDFGCRSFSDTYVPLSPDYYFQYFPTGCYNLCLQQLPLTLYGPPNISFAGWDWLMNGTDTVSSGTGVMPPYGINASGQYQWALNNGLCAQTSDTMFVSTTNCNDCDQFYVTVSMVCEPSNPACYLANINITSPLGTTYTLGTNEGPLYPFSGTLTASPTLLSLTFATLDTLATSVTIEIEFTLPDGNKCFKEITTSLPPCSWISERQDTTTKSNNSLQMTNSMLVYPNPATQQVNISYNYGTENYNERSISVYDQLGRKTQYIDLQDSHGTWNLNTANWTPGIYIIRMEGDGKALQVQRLVVSN